MCLDVLKCSVKPASSKRRKTVYKIVRSYQDGSYRNLFAGNDMIYRDNVMARSNRSVELPAQFANKYSESHDGPIVNYGIHVFMSLRNAKAFMAEYQNAIDKILKKFENIPEELAEFHAHWGNAKMAIIKCAVSSDDHVADGVFSVIGGKTYKSAVYDRIIPNKMIYSKAVC